VGMIVLHIDADALMAPRLSFDLGDQTSYNGKQDI
jgi:hypothetical protein